MSTASKFNSETEILLSDKEMYKKQSSLMADEMRTDKAKYYTDNSRRAGPGKKSLRTTHHTDEI